MTLLLPKRNLSFFMYLLSKSSFNFFHVVLIYTMKYKDDKTHFQTIKKSAEKIVTKGTSLIVKFSLIKML